MNTMNNAAVDKLKTQSFPADIRVIDIHANDGDMEETTIGDIVQSGANQDLRRFQLMKRGTAPFTYLWNDGTPLIQFEDHDQVFRLDVTEPKPIIKPVGLQRKLKVPDPDVFRFGSLVKEPQEPEERIFNGDHGGLATVDIWQVYAPTGVGKTLFAQPLAMAVAAGSRFLDWQADKPRKVVYLDGEMPQATMIDRGLMFCDEMSAAQQGKVDENLYLINREKLAEENIDLPPLDTEEGQAFLLDLVDRTDASLVVFDSRFCLVASELREAGSLPQELLRELRHRHVAQIWLHHTGKDVKKGGYGDSTAEWLLDANIELMRNTGTVPETLSLKFKKRRKQCPENYDFYRDRTLAVVDNRWQEIDASELEAGNRAPTTVKAMDDILKHLDDLGGDRMPVDIKALRARLAKKQVYPTTETGKALTPNARHLVTRYVGYLVDDGLVEELPEGLKIVPRGSKNTPGV